MSTFNHASLAPIGHETVSSRYNTQNVYEVAAARPARNRLGERGGERMAETQSWRDPAVGTGFYQGARAQDAGDGPERPGSVKEYIDAPGRSRLGTSHPVRQASVAGDYLAVPPELPHQFSEAMDFGDPGTPGPAISPSGRPGAWNANTITPLGRRGERQGNEIVKVIGRNPRRRSTAEISGGRR
jgi:hypothetical protein